MNRTITIAVATLLLASVRHINADEPKPAAPAEAADLAQLQAEFAKRMTGATMVGYFTTDGKEGQGLSEESYQLKTVKKLSRGDYWLFEYKYGDKGQAIPLSLEIKWAGDTPMISMTEVMVPGFGTFSARVLFYKSDYAGTWSASDHGGKLFGRIKPAEEKGEG